MALDLIPKLHRATHAVALYLHNRREELEVSQGEAHVLAHLAGAGPCRIADIHRSFGHKRSTLTSILDRLEKRGLLDREINPDDRRSYLLRLTRSGKPVANAVYKALAKLEKAVATHLDKDQLAAFAAVADVISTTGEDDQGHALR